MCLGIPGKIIEIDDDGGLPMGVVDFGGVRRAVCLAYVRPEIGLGDYVIVHVGFAISKVDEAEAQRTFDVLREMSKHDELDWMAELGAVPSSVPIAATARGTAT
ncbi:MAG TPA: HypC/HybG/HupF family hydrogenase formation chaperone [Gemmatimonadaceae bacterium]